MKNSKKKRKEYKIPSREEQIKKYQNISPSQIFYNPNTIKWFKKKYNEDLIKKSIYSLFPNNCQPIMTEEEWTPQRILREFLTHYWHTLHFSFALRSFLYIFYFVDLN